MTKEEPEIIELVDRETKAWDTPGMENDHAHGSA